MNSKSRIILLSCGSFNPITNMHLRLFELSRDHLQNSGFYEVIGGIISPVNDGYNKKNLISAKHRCEMVDRALQTSNWIKLDRWECNQESWTCTVKVLEHHQSEFDSIVNTNFNEVTPSKRQKLTIESLNSVNNNDRLKDWDLSKPVHVMLLCGADMLESFSVPNLWEDSHIEKIVGTFGLVVVSRSGSDPERFIYESDILSRHKKNIHIATEWITNEISSTHIRRALSRGNSVKYLIPDTVLEYIKEHNLFSSNNVELKQKKTS